MRTAFRPERDLSGMLICPPPLPWDWSEHQSGDLSGMRTGFRPERDLSGMLICPLPLPVE